MRAPQPTQGFRTLIPVAAVFALLVIAPAAQASKNIVGFVGEKGSAAALATEAGTLRNASGVAINETGSGSGAEAGDIYVFDNRNFGNDIGYGRVNQYDSLGNFIRLFGPDVVLSGPDDTGPNEQQTIDVPASVTSGTFTVEVITAKGQGNYFQGNNVIKGVVTSTGAFRVGDEIHGVGITAGTTIKEVGDEEIVLSTEAFTGQGGAKISAGETTGSIDYNAAANTGVGGANLQATFEALPAIGPGNISVSGGPGASGTPFTVTFSGGVLAHDDVAPMVVSSNLLIGGSATIATVGQGGGPEVCQAASSPVDVCKMSTRVTDGEPAALGSSSAVALDQATGNLFVADPGYNRISVFGSDGRFQGAFGWGVATGASQLEFCTTVCQVGLFGSGAGQGVGQLAIDPATGNLFATGTNRVQEFSFSLNGSDEVVGVSVDRVFGWDVVKSGPDQVAAPDEEQQLVVKADGGNFRLSFGSSQTAPISFEAPASGVGSAEEALNALPSIGGLSPPGSVTVAGGPGDENGTNPYVITFGGSLGGDDVPEITTSASELVKSGGTPSAVVTTIADGGAFEVCNLALNPTDVCGAGSAGTHVGQFGSSTSSGPDSVAVNSTGTVYTADRSGGGRIQAFTPAGSSYTPALFDPVDLNGTLEDVIIGPADRVLVNKAFPSGATTCPDGSPSKNEGRLLEANSAGSLLETDLTCAGAFIANAAANIATGDILFTSFREGPGGFADNIATVFFLGETGPPTAAINTIAPNTSGATITATINPGGPAGTFPNPPTTSYQLEYKKSSDATWTKWAKPIDIGSGVSNVPVTIHLGTLQGNTSYDTRLVANKTFGEGTDTTALQTFATLPVPPTVDAFSSSGVTATSADLHAQINPHGAITTYRFEYGTGTSYGSSLPIPEGELPASQTDQAVSVHLEGLERGVVYHFRVVASNTTGTTISRDQTFNYFPPGCPNATVRQQTGSAYLPDCRGYELVSPGDAGQILLINGGIPAPYASSPSRLSFRGALGAVSGTEPTNSLVFNTYIATRTGTGWVTHYVGVKGPEAWTESNLVGDLGLDTFLNLRLGDNPGSNIPYIWDAEGNSLGRWPADFASVPSGDIVEGGIQPSPDFSHMAFSSNNVDFDPKGEGLTTAPGSAYDYDVKAGTTTLISKTAAGGSIPQEPSNLTDIHEFIYFPGGFGVDPSEPARINPSVSTDGSHILMSTRQEPDNSFTPELPAGRLYMRVNDAVTYEVSHGKDVDYRGMTASGGKVFYTTKEKLTTDDHDTSTDLYMWSEAGDSLTLLSAGAGAGDTDHCFADWTSKCDVVVATTRGSGVGSGPDVTDNWIAANSDDIYFYSPELLDGPAHGIDGGRNLFVYREGHPQFVVTLGSSEPLARIQVSPQGDKAAFLTASRLTPYDNAGFSEMYSFDPASGAVTCVSCIPSGAAPTDDVRGSLSGIFMSDDGRTFFSTTDPLVSQDTNGLTDVYEYVDGRAQLITAGTGAADKRPGPTGNRAGLAGVSADGTDVYFSTYDTLVAQDHNGQFMKFYDARAGGGFPAPVEPTPCEAADECHGAGSASPVPPLIVSGRNLGSGGNASSHKPRKKHRRRHSHRHRSPHGHHNGHGGRGAR